MDPAAAAEPVSPEVLEAFGFPGASCSRLEGGLMNQHWLVSSGERRCVIRRYHLLRTAAAIGWEQDLVEHAGSRGWPVAPALPAIDGTKLVAHAGRLWAAAAYLEGETGAMETPASFHIAGRLLGRLHRDLASFELDGQRPDFGKTWELDSAVAPAGEGSFNDLLAAFAREHPDLASLIRRQRYRNLRELARLKYPDLPDRPIHGDFQRSNLLWTDGRFSGLLDFDQSRRDALVCDIAPLLVPFQPLDQKLAAALLSGYQTVRPLSDAEWELLPALVRSALLWWVAFLLVQWRTRGGSVEGIARTMTVRFPAFEAAEPAYRGLRAGTSPSAG
ncbi:MAG: phosphotransferase [Dehalococcoidia bacterium]|uniref:phosphotransferase n=1 Tax=Candidatus Amarobacter glycogenicus TaxID=3140699 RepID=UPI0031355F5A|nr:phosphotransferase [Dehalococcoidia bacterium]